MAEQKHTEFAMKALGMADAFKMTIGEKPVGQQVQYRVELSAPEGHSTGGGKQAVQHINVTPIQGGTTLVAGNANQVDKTAELRSWEYLCWMHEQRFKGGAPSIERIAYDELLQRLATFFHNQGLQVKTLEAPASAASPEAPAKSGSPAMIAVLVVAVVVIVVLGILLMKR